MNTIFAVASLDFVKQYSHIKPFTSEQKDLLLLLIFISIPVVTGIILHFKAKKSDLK